LSLMLGERADRTLRERVTIANTSNPPRDVSLIWRRQITDEVGVEIIYVAALRSVGVPARLDRNGRAEFGWGSMVGGAGAGGGELVRNENSHADQGPITPADQAEAYFLLVSKRLSKTTGQIITVNGGLHEVFLR
jgi:hypothetical protein